jgi:hypothetical protein
LAARHHKILKLEQGSSHFTHFCAFQASPGSFDPKKGAGGDKVSQVLLDIVGISMYINIM